MFAPSYNLDRALRQVLSNNEKRDHNAVELGSQDGAFLASWNFNALTVAISQPVLAESELLLWQGGMCISQAQHHGLGLCGEGLTDGSATRSGTFWACTNRLHYATAGSDRALQPPHLCRISES